MVLDKDGWLFIDRDKAIIVVEFITNWEVSVLLAVLEWHVRIRVFPEQKLGDLALQNASEYTSGQLAQLYRPSLSQLDYCKDLVKVDFG